MEFLKKLGKGLEKYLLRPTLQFTKNRFKEKSTLAAIVVGVGSSVGYEINPELAGAVVDGIMLASGLEMQLTAAEVVKGITVAAIGTFLAPTSKIKEVKNLKKVKK